MTTPEGRLSRQIIKALNQLPRTFAWKMHGSEFMVAGLPDIIVCVEGKFLGLETKMPERRSRVSKRQERVHDQIKQAGGVVHVVTSIAEATAAWALLASP